MKIEGSYTISAPREAVWEALNDPNVLSKTIPGGQELEMTGENQYKAKMKIRVGPVQGIFNGNVKLTDLKPPESYHMVVDGRGAPGFVKGEGDLRLEDQGENTVLHYDGDAQVGGRLASVGQRLMDTSAQALIRQSLETLETQIKAGQQSAETGEPAPEIAPPSELQFAMGVTRKMIEDALPEEKRPEMMRAAIIALAIILVMKTLSDWWMDRLASRVVKKLEKRR
ncbi:MAG: carbon monoxide dehydrogenase subunit G [Phycisphaerae bacterium]|nr:carbon monoxide dehydrogenase subunit G [Phycisphaerae bacterium]NIX26823.1 carbon monoxide dehydrogenase [Phycisphaerae bacterium]